MIVAYHVIFSAYGFWLPNDPRGSWSDFIGSWELLRYGPATKTQERKSLAYRSHDRATRLAAKKSLKYPPVEFTGIQARAVAQGFGNYSSRLGLPIWACAVLPDHVHLVVGRSPIFIEQLVIQLKAAATRQLLEKKIHPLEEWAANGKTPKCFVRGGWNVFLDDDDLDRAIRYVRSNPLKEEKKLQNWSFVTSPY